MGGDPAEEGQTETMPLRRTRAINGQWKLMGINNQVLILMKINGD